MTVLDLVHAAVLVGLAGATAGFVWLTLDCRRRRRG